MMRAGQNASIAGCSGTWNEKKSRIAAALFLY
jgi:hypothetical protein